MAIKYLYIDDDPEAQGTIPGLQKENMLEIKFDLPKVEWEKQIKVFQPTFEFDGLILDLKLNEKFIDGDKKTKFRGTSLAQEIRTLVKEEQLRDFPIVLFSATSKLVSSLDNTGIDLFDLCIPKESMQVVTSYIDLTNKLISLSNGYNSIYEHRQSIERILDISDISILDVRLYEDFKRYLIKPVHILAGFIISEILDRPGLLIDESFLSARLGINRVESLESWQIILDKLEIAKYNGVFHEGWHRWWMASIDDWWAREISNDNSLQRSNAEERVELLNTKFSLTLVAAEKTEKSKSSAFWTVCKGSGRPIDPDDGLLLINQDSLYPWQDRFYISVDAALSRENIDEWKDVSAFEKDRLEMLKNLYPNVRPPR